MPKYSIRHYFESCDEFEVEADSLEAAALLVGEAIAPLQAGVTQVGENTFCDWTSTMGNEIDAEGQWVDDPKEL